MRKLVTGQGLILVLIVFFTIPPIATYAQARCNVRTYSIGSIDTLFGIASTTLASRLQEAERVWENAAQKELFRATDSGGIVVNLLYDGRQATILQLEDREKKLAAIKDVFSALQKTHATLVSETKTAMTNNIQRFASYIQEQTAFNADVVRINAIGGGTQADYAAFGTRKQILEQRFAELKSTESELNAKAASLNALSESLNLVVAALNQIVNNHNAEVARLGEFEQGFYRRAGNDESIGIYGFANANQLTRVLAHEFGHALGMQHISDPQAIMYASNTGTSLTPTADDMAEYARVCR